MARVAIDATEAHEEALVFAYRGVAWAGELHPLEVHPLLLALYTQLGQIFGPELVAFVALAFLLGGVGPVLAGLAGQLSTRSPWVGWTLALLLTLHPALTYWRVQGFHVGAPHTAFCATLLAAVLVARRPDRLNIAAWMILGAFTLFFRLELAGAVAATALVPLLTGPPRWWASPRTWLPGLVAALLLVGLPTLSSFRAIAEREDYWVALRFLGIHLGITEMFQPLSFLPALLAVPAGVASLLLFTRAAEERRLAVALGAGSLLGLFPAIVFSGFGPRHLLPSSTLALLFLITSLAPALRSSWSGRIPSIVAAVGLLVWTGSLSWQSLEDMSDRYGIDPTFVPQLPQTPRPTTPLPDDFNVNLCASYSGASELCEPWQFCQPPKDLRDPVRVRERRDMVPGNCVVWAIDDREDDVRGVRHEYWMVLRQLYRWEAVGYIDLIEEGGIHRRVDLYRLAAPP